MPRSRVAILILPPAAIALLTAVFWDALVSIYYRTSNDEIAARMYILRLYIDEYEKVHLKHPRRFDELVDAYSGKYPLVSTYRDPSKGKLQPFIYVFDERTGVPDHDRILFVTQIIGTGTYRYRLMIRTTGYVSSISENEFRKTSQELTIENLRLRYELKNTNQNPAI